MYVDWTRFSPSMPAPRPLDTAGAPTCDGLVNNVAAG
jgi:hypothetical protein